MSLNVVSPEPSNPTGSDRLLRWVVLLAATTPAIAATLSAIGAHWVPGGDQALEVLRISDVGGSHTPLLGAWSRWGWSHPGPALFWLLAPWQRALGNDGVLLGCGLIAISSIGGAVAIGLRRGGTALGALVALAGVVLTSALGLSVLVDVWNPFVALLPFLLFLMLIWSVACDDLVMAPAAAAVGTFCVQAHVGFLPLVGGLCAAAVAAVAVRHLGRRRTSSPEPPHSDRPEGRVRGWIAEHRLATSAIATAVVGVLMWLPVAADEVWGSHNLTALWHYMRSPDSATAGLASALRVMSGQFRIPAPWMGAANTDEHGLSIPAHWGWGAAAVLLLVTAAAWAIRRRRQETALLDAVALVGIGFGIWSTARVTGPLFAYTMQWWWILSMFAAVAVVWTTLDATGARRHRFVPILLVAATGTLGAWAMLRDLPIDPPQPVLSRELAHLVGPTARALDATSTYSIHAVDQRNLGGVGPGMLLGLRQQGIQAFAAPGVGADIQYGTQRVRPPEETDGVLDVVSLEALDDGWEPQPGSREISRYDPLTPAERDEYRRLQRRIRSSLGPSAPPGILQMTTEGDVRRARRHGVSHADIERFRKLEALGSGFAVLLSPTPTP